jgi:L-malate glycosyltransferase
MRILYFTRGYTVHDARFLRELAASTHEIWFLPYFQADGAEWRLPDRVHRARWTLPGAPADGSLDGAVASMTAFEAILSSVRPDVLHAGPIQPCGFMAALSGFHPLLVMSWGFDILLEAEASDQARWVTRFALRNADLLLCDCRAVREKASEIHPLEQTRVLELPWGVDLQDFRPRPPAGERASRFGWGEESFVVLSTRAWEPLYGTETLLEAFRLAFESNKRLRLVLAGSGSLSPLVGDFASDPALRGSVHLAGAVAQEELPRYFQEADLYLSCSTVDGTSVSLLEALASGLPVVVSDLPSNREWVLPGENGWLGTPGRPDSFAAAILEAAAAPARLEEIARANRKIAETRADWHTNFRNVLTAYDLLARPGSFSRS